MDQQNGGGHPKRLLGEPAIAMLEHNSMNMSIVTSQERDHNQIARVYT